MIRALALILIIGCRPASPVEPGLGESSLGELGAAGTRAIDGARIEAHTKYLASDELGGRAPGSAGGIQAEDYVAKQFEAVGLRPAGQAGTWFQQVPLRAAKRDDAGCALIVRGKGEVSFESNKDVIFRPNAHAAAVALDAPLVYAGYGISAPKLGYDDLAGVDLRGAIAVVLGGAPHQIAGQPVPSALRAVLSDLAERTRVLRDRGAVAMLTVYTPDRERYLSWDFTIANWRFEAMAWLERGVPGSTPVLPVAQLNMRALDRLLDAASINGGAEALWKAADAGQQPRLTLDANASLKIRSIHRDIIARNVVGILPGSDPEASAETVVYTAHLDHLGIGETVNGDAIYNGALDDAIGVAGVIEIARGFVALPERPRRSMLFLVVAAEETGLRGSDYFLAHPTVPIDRIIADINIDGLTPIWEPFDVIALGAEHSSLAENVRAAAQASGLAVSPDPNPDEVFFIRSDQYSFAKRGIPSVFPGAGYMDATGKNDVNRALGDAWYSAHYHKPSDEWRSEYKGDWAAKEARFDLLLGLSVAMAPQRPTWNKGSVFAGRLW